MAEQEETQEEKFDFTSEGESQRYISLAQARLLAMQTARETPGNYGRRFSAMPMVFTVTESGEDEDYYTVILSFRPEAGFNGTPGREQFFISKEGDVALRQVLDPPRGRLRRRLLIIAGIAAVIVAAALVASMIFGSKPGPFGGPSSVPPTAVPNATSTANPTAVPTSIDDFTAEGEALAPRKARPRQRVERSSIQNRTSLKLVSSSRLVETPPPHPEIAARPPRLQSHQRSSAFLRRGPWPRPGTRTP